MAGAEAGLTGGGAGRRRGRQEGGGVSLVVAALSLRVLTSALAGVACLVPRCFRR